MDYKIINVVLDLEYYLAKYFLLVKINPIPKKPRSEDIWAWEYHFYCLRGNIKKIISPLMFEKLWDRGSKVAIASKKRGYNSELDNEQLIWIIKNDIFKTMFDLGKYASIYGYGCISIKNNRRNA